MMQGFGLFVGAVTGCLLTLLTLDPRPAAADGIIDVVDAPTPPFNTSPHLFPNWLQAPTASFQIAECDDTLCAGCAASNLTGVTIMNYGTATGGAAGDITNLYFRIVCGATNVIRTMTWANNWGGIPAWTWAGPALALPDACTNCACALGLYLYTDINACPTDGASVILGPGFNLVANPGWPGGVYDSCGYAGPWSKAQDAVAKTIRYVAKTADKSEAAPGDTVTYTITYGRPGTTPLTQMWITDTLPPNTHYAAPGAIPPDVGWDPDIGPPLRLRWSVAGGATTGGPTGQVTFRASVDWGNGEAFEPGSGNVAAPEGAFLFNQAHLAWDPPTTCASGRSSNVPSLVVRRYLYWMIGDNDILFAPRLGQPDDEMIYSIFVRNVSTTKTWWDLSIWDTVPSQIDPWAANLGFEDPCAGWTMTPTGCAAASPGRRVTAGTTLLTWTIDLPPSATLSLRWKGRVVPTTTSGSTAINRIGLLALGQTGVAGGTGHAQTPRSFTHLATVVLRTTYTSYVGFAGGTAGGCGVGPTYFISLYPLNKASDAILYRQWCCPASPPCNPACAGFAATGGVSPRIDVYSGSCAAGPVTDWEPGCKVERSPARYTPAFFITGATVTDPYNFLHKLVANAPFIWELATCFQGGGEDANTLAGTTSLSYCGYIAYTYARLDFWPNELETLYFGNMDPNVNTTLHLFEWNPATLAWDYLTTKDVYQESQWAYPPIATRHYRIISSDAPIVVHKAFTGIGIGGAFNDFGTLFANRENGNLVNASAPANFYFWAPAASSDNSTVIGNVGTVKASFQIWMYKPFDPTLPSPTLAIPAELVDSAGSWSFVGADTVDAGIAAALNPKIYGNGYDTTTFGPTYHYYRMTVTGPANAAVQIWAGREIFSGYSGGAVLHSSNPVGASYGREYWIHEATADNGCSKGSDIDADIDVIDVFSPKTNLAVNVRSSDGYSATYTTTDVDQCIAFKSLTTPTGGQRRNWVITVQPGGNPGDVITQYINCIWKEKFYAAPFLAKGVYYDILVPPVVYVGQSFWLTIVVMEAGTTKVDYCGTSTFTSTDPSGKIEGAAMDTYNYTWSSSTAPCNGGAPINGWRVFVNVSFTRLGLQTIVASDTIDGSITGLATLMVVGADVKLEKSPRLGVNASGDTVQFRICWSNYSSASAFTFTMTDAVPQGTTYLPEAGTWGLSCGNTDSLGLAVAYSTATTATMPAAASFVAGNPTAATRWLRWTVPWAGVQTTGCACFRVTVQ